MIFICIFSTLKSFLVRALKAATPQPTQGLSYAQAGVSIDAGNSFVEIIKPLVRATRRPGATGEIGRFGGLFDIKAIAHKDPVLVASADGVGTKLKIATEVGIHDSVGACNSFPALGSQVDHGCVGYVVKGSTSWP
jgi:hypothetical protein